MAPYQLYSSPFIRGLTVSAEKVACPIPLSICSLDHIPFQLRVREVFIELLLI